MRIVSLLGSATEIAFALGLGDRLVGISHECDWPPAALRLPRVSRPRFDPRGLDSGQVDAAVRRSMEEHGSVYEIDVERLRQLRPDLVLTQAVCEVCAVPTGSVEAAVASLPSGVQVLSLDAHDLEEILGTVTAVAQAAGEPGRGERVVAGLRERFAAVAAAVASQPRPSVLLLEWLDPPFAPGHWVPEMVELAGGDNLIGASGNPSRQITWASIEHLDPDVLLIEPCGYGLEDAARDAEQHRGRLLGLARRAVAGDRAWLLHSAWYSRSGPRVVEGVEVLAKLLHPRSFPGVGLGGRAARWTLNERA